MTALSFNLTPSKSIDIAGLPLEGLPPLEAGRTLPGAFAELLGKASKAAGKPAVEGDSPGKPKAAEAEVAAEGDGVEAGIDAGLRPTSKLVPPVPAAPSNTTLPDGEPLPPGEIEAETGKDLPPVRTEIAAAPPAPSIPAPIHQSGKATPLANQRETGSEPKPRAKSDAAPATPAPPAAPAAPAKTSRETSVPPIVKAKPVAIEGEDVAPEVAVGVKERAGATPKEARSDDPRIERTQEAKATRGIEGAVPVAQPAPIDLAVETLDTPTAAPVDVPTVIAAANIAVVQQGNTAPDPAAGRTASPATSANTPTAFAKVDGAASQTAQQFLGRDGAPRGDGKAQTVQPAPDQSIRQASQPTSDAPAAPPAKVAAELPQTGLSLQLRAADKPVAADRPMIAIDASQPATQSASGTSPVQGIAAPVGHTPFATPTLGSAPQTGPLPHFPDLAGLVDRIAAARSSAGSASATIAVAHKELGNLSLTFEATGNTLDVEVAAQDSDTQRSLAAAIAADRPHLRTVDAQAQAPSQTLHSQLASSAHGGGTDARQSGMAGDAQSDRRGDTDGSGRGTGRQGNEASAQGRPDPKSDGGIYA
ncbi:hypothetical protein [Citromicrobium bathyomarinum]|uniref:hypothetical protein n=1 Tax=Citromicrobium bathyomarinum TaxID=72174 RepID=UPI003159B701